MAGPDVEGCRSPSENGSVNAKGWQRRWISVALATCLILVTAYVVAAMVDSSTPHRRLALDEDDTQEQDPKLEASKKLHQWWEDVEEMQKEVQEFQSEANEKSVDELVHLARVKDLLAELQKQVPAYTPPPPPVTPWDYSKDANGPANWGNLSPDYQACSTGKSQSPINIELDLQAADLPSIGWHLAEDTKFQVRPKKGGSTIAGREFYDGHTFEVDELGRPSMTIGGVDYFLEEFHFHTPAEHAVAGRHFAAEIQFSHASADGQRLVVAAFFHRGHRSPPFLEQLVAEAIPKATAVPQQLVELKFESIAQSILVGSVPSKPVPAKEFVPNFKNYFQYSGSLSTPPCTEGVTWVVFKNAVHIAEADLAVLKALEGTNVRPIQPLDGRKVLDVGGVGADN